MWDVFISHAREDKDSVARPLAEELTKLGLKVWYDEFTLKIGDSLRRSIDEGLAKSTFGIVILSPFFLKKQWTQIELDGLATRQSDGRNVILPVWHNVSRDEIAAYSPTLADRIAANTSDGIPKIVNQLAEVLCPGPEAKSKTPATTTSEAIHIPRPHALSMIVGFGVGALVWLSFYLRFSDAAVMPIMTGLAAMAGVGSIIGFVRRRTAYLVSYRTIVFLGLLTGFWMGAGFGLLERLFPNIRDVDPDLFNSPIFFIRLTLYFMFVSALCCAIELFSWRNRTKPPSK